MLNKVQKETIVNELIESYSSKEAIVIANYSNLKVNDIVDLRKSITKEGFKAKVYKNRLFKRSLDSKGVDVPGETLKGQNIYFETSSDVVSLCKLLVNYSKENENLQLTGGILDGAYITPHQISDLSKLPTKEELIAKFIGQVKSPISKLVMTLSNPINGFAHVLSNIKNKIGGD